MGKVGVFLETMVIVVVHGYLAFDDFDLSTVVVDIVGVL